MRRRGGSDSEPKEGQPRLKATLFGRLPAGSAPLYQRIADQLRAAIGRRRVAVGVQLPTEDELAQQFGVSSITVRAALRTLQDKGLIERRQGRGTFVRRPDDPPAEWGLGSVEDLVMTGRLTEVKVLRCALDDAPGWAEPLLGPPPAQGFLHVRITRNQDGSPFMMTDAFYPGPVGDKLAAHDLPRLLVRSHLLIEVVEQLTGERVTDISQTMTAGIAGADVARTISVRRASPILTVTRINRTQNGTLLQVARSHYRTDGVEYSIHLKRG
jgi:GntR family transcriptional regulator